MQELMSGNVLPETDHVTNTVIRNGYQCLFRPLGPGVSMAECYLKCPSGFANHYRIFPVARARNAASLYGCLANLRSVDIHVLAQSVRG